MDDLHPWSVDAVITPMEEKQIAREFSPAIAWPTLSLAVAAPAAFLGIVYLGLSRAAPLWLCTVLLTIVSYTHYTLVHESIHGNLAPGHPRWRWLNPLVGWIGSLGLANNWPFLMRTHGRHHAHTNTDQDPDLFVKGSLGQLIMKWAVSAPVSLLPLALVRFVRPAFYERLKRLLVGAEILQASAATAFTLVLLVLALATGRVMDWLCLWFIPTRLAMLALHILFQWLPHHPFDRTERYYNTRLSLWAGGGVATLQQNLHLMHHLWPSVPFYNYGRLYRRLRPLLVAKAVRIEGLFVGSSVKIEASDP
jgi:beta-carotene hydroxylase